MSYDISSLDIGKTFTTPLLIPQGFYHVQLDDFRETPKEQGKSIALHWKIVGAPTDDDMLKAVGKVIYEYLSEWTEFFPKQLVRIGMACGAYTAEYLKDLQAKGEALSYPDFYDWRGRSCVVKVSHKPDFRDAKKMVAKIGFDYFPVDSEETQAAGVVLNTAILSADQVATPRDDDQF